MSLVSLTRNVLSNYAALAVTGVAGFVLTPLLFHSLQPQNYGILVFALNAVAIMQGIDLGLFSSLVRFISKLAAEQKLSELKCLASTAFYLLLGIGLFGAAVFVALSPLLARFFRLGAAADPRGAMVLQLLGLSLAFQFPSYGLRTFLEGCQDFQRANAVEILMQLVRIVATLVLLRAGFGLLAVAVLVPAISLLRLIGMLFMVRRASIPFWPAWAEVNFRSLAQIRHFASLSFLGENANRCFFAMDSILAARLLALPDLAILNIARRFPWALRDFSWQPLAVAYPLLSSADARGDRGTLHKFLFLSARNLLAFSLPFAAVLYVWSEVILRLWIGQELAVAVSVFRVYLVFAVFASLQEIPLYLLYGMGRIRFSAWLLVTMVGAAIPIGGWACWRGGLTGLTLAFAAMQVTATLLLFHRALSAAELEFRPLLRKAVLPPILALLPTVAWLGFSYRILPHAFLGLVVSAISSLLLFAGLFVRFTARRRTQAWRAWARKLLYEID